MDSHKVVVFETKEEFCLPIEYVVSIEKMQSITHIPKMPPYMVGVFRSRGELIPVLDMGYILYDVPTSTSDETRIIVVSTTDISVGLLVDAAKEILDIPADQMKQINIVAYQNTDYFVGVASLESRLLTAIDPRKLFNSLEGIQEIKEHIMSNQES